MASGIFGTLRSADVAPQDVEIFYTYASDRTVQASTLTKIANSSDILVKAQNPNSPYSFEMFSGMYTLQLPTTIFSTAGIYTIILKPVEIRTNIVDVGVLSAYPNINGLLFDLSTIPTNFLTYFENNGLIGYKVEYLNPSASDAKVNNTFTIITSNNRAEPVNQNLTNTNQKSIRYRFNDNSTLIFCTVSPNSAPNVTPNAYPFIGQVNQPVIITNTFFNPIMIELELVTNTLDTIAYALYGNQSKSIDDGIFTIYNFNNQIYKQYDLYEIKDAYTGLPLFEIRDQRTNIDFTKNFTTITTV